MKGQFKPNKAIIGALFTPLRFGVVLTRGGFATLPQSSTP